MLRCQIEMCQSCKNKMDFKRWLEVHGSQAGTLPSIHVHHPDHR
jgi:hypothetical protein